MTDRHFWKNDQSIILASTSATRLKVLTSAGIPCRTVAPGVDERRIAGPHEAQGATAGEIAAILAKAKACSVSQKMTDAYVLGADQTLALGDQIFSKPASKAEAAAHLRSLQGRTHQLHSALAIALNGAIVYDVVATANLTMRELDDDFIETYLEAAGDRVQQSVGAYQIEGLGIHLFEQIEGDHSTILGLPLLPLLTFLRSRRLIAT